MKYNNDPMMEDIKAPQQPVVPAPEAEVPAPEPTVPKPETVQPQEAEGTNAKAPAEEGTNSKESEKELVSDTLAAPEPKPEAEPQ
jgi:hypothetical protein